MSTELPTQPPKPLPWDIFHTWQCFPQFDSILLHHWSRSSCNQAASFSLLLPSPTFSACYIHSRLFNFLSVWWTKDFLNEPSVAMEMMGSTKELYDKLTGKNVFLINEKSFEFAWHKHAVTSSYVTHMISHTLNLTVSNCLVWFTTKNVEWQENVKKITSSGYWFRSKPPPPSPNTQFSKVTNSWD